MTESCVQEIKLPNPKLISFIREVESKHGIILTLSELYARDQKLGSEIILVRIMKLKVFEMLTVIFGSRNRK
jgi:hypothetical protein